MGRKANPKATTDNGPPPPPMPDGLRARTFSVGEEEFAVLVFPTQQGEDHASKLTSAELSVVEHALKGFSNEEIASLRGSSVRTVANQLQAIYRKLGVNSRIELAQRMSR